MNDTVKLLFDECVGHAVAEHFEAFLRQMSNEPIEVKHLRNFQLCSTPDEVWVPQMAASGFILISADKSKDPKGKKLKLLCLKYSMTQITLGKSIHHLPSGQKIIAVTEAWSSIVRAAKSDRGLRYTLAMVPGGHPTLSPRAIPESERQKAAMYLEHFDSP